MPNDADVNDDESDNYQTLILTANEFLYHGLNMFYTERRIAGAQPKTNAQRHIDHFGVSHVLTTEVWEDLQTTSIKTRIYQPKRKHIDCYLSAIYLLNRYPVEKEREAKHDRAPTTLREWNWHHVEKVRDLKVHKILWPEDNFG